MGRLYSPNGQPVTAEFRVSTGSGFCAQAAVAGVGGGFGVVWAQKDPSGTDGWDIYSRGVAPDGSSPADPVRVNSYTVGDQFGPKASAVGTNQLVVWTSLAEDGSYEGI